MESENTTIVQWYALRTRLSEDIMWKIAHMHALRLSPFQIMGQHTKEVSELSMSNGVVVYDTFVSFVDMHNVCCKCAKELQEKNQLDPIGICMWTHVFYHEPKHNTT